MLNTKCVHESYFQLYKLLRRHYHDNQTFRKKEATYLVLTSKFPDKPCSIASWGIGRVSGILSECCVLCMQHLQPFVLALKHTTW